MASISETAGLINSAGTDVAEARGKVVEAQTAVERAQRALFEAMGEASPGKLEEYMGALNNALIVMDRAIAFMEGGMDCGQAYIAQLHS